MFTKSIKLTTHLSVLNSVGLAPPWVFRVSCHRVIVSSWVRNFFSRVFCGFKNFFRRYFVGPRFFLVGRLWVQEFFSWVFCGFKTFSGEYFVGPKFFLSGVLWVQNIFLVGIAWVQDFFSWVIGGSNAFFLVGMFWVQNYFSWVFSWVQSFFSLRNTCYRIIVSNFSTHPLQRSKYHVEKKGDQT